jgi:hypothetical protein
MLHGTTNAPPNVTFTNENVHGMRFLTSTPMLHETTNAPPNVTSTNENGHGTFFTTTNAFCSNVNVFNNYTFVV